MSSITNPSIDEVVRDTRARNLLKKYGYLTYNDLKVLTHEDIKKMDGLGGVCGHRAFDQIQEYRKVLYLELVELTKDAADKVGVQKVIETIEALIAD